MDRSIGAITFRKKSALQRLPRFPGRARLVAAIWRVLPFLKAEASLRVSPSHTFLLDSTYPTHVATILDQGNERDEIQVLTSLLRPGDVFMDIGANWGMFSIVAAHVVGPEGRVISVEGNAAAFRHLIETRDKAHIPNVLALHYAISNVSGNPSAVQPGFLRMDTGGHLKPSVHGVVSITLDDLHRLIGKPRIALLKMDIEGAEPLALESGTQTLSATEFVLIEVSDYTVRFGRSRNDVYSAMQRAGFRYSWFYSGNKRTDDDPRPAANVLFGRAPSPELPPPVLLS